MKNMAPYQFFFPIGILCALLAVGVWFTQNLNLFSSPALFIHSKLIVGGFIWSFIIGFLMTAIPRMTGTSSANKFEYLGAFTLIFSMIGLSWKLDGKPFYIANALLVLFLIVYAGRRIFISNRPVPVFFSHVGVALVLALCGIYYHATGYSLLGIHLYHVGATLLLVLGIGTRFFSFLSGLPSAFENILNPWARWGFHSLAVLNGVLLYLAGIGFSSAYLGLTLIALVYLFFIWKVQRPSDRPSALKWGMRLVAAMIPLSFALCWLDPSHFLTWLHLLFIGSFGLIIFAVATRVTLAHGAYPTDLEMHSKELWWMLGFLTIGIIFRVIYGFADGVWKNHFLHLAALFWFLAVGAWCYSYLIRIFKPGPQQKPSC